MFFKWLVLDKGGVDEVGCESADSSDNAVSVAMAHWNVEHRVFAVRYWDGLQHLNASTYRSIVFRSGIAPGRSTLNFRRKRHWTVTTESLFLKNCSTTKTRCSKFQCAMGTETALSELSAGSRPTSSTPLLPSTSYLKNMRFLCSTLYKRFATPRLRVALPTVPVLYDGDLSDCKVAGPTAVARA